MKKEVEVVLFGLGPMGKLRAHIALLSMYACKRELHSLWSGLLQSALDNQLYNFEDFFCRQMLLHILLVNVHPRLKRIVKLSSRSILHTPHVFVWINLKFLLAIVSWGEIRIMSRWHVWWYVKKCGLEMRSSWEFCPSCGDKIVSPGKYKPFERDWCKLAGT